MARVIIVIGVLTIFTVALCAPLGAEPVVSEEIRHYGINGLTAEDLRREMNQKGPKGADGDPFDAYTAWSVNWDYRWWEKPGDCRVTSVKTRVRVTFTLPVWRNYAAADAALKQKWDRYYQALYEHEKGHRDFGIQAAREIERAILNVGRRDNCRLLSRDAEAAARTLLDRYIQLEERYDGQTAHGAETGAVFP